MKLRKCVILIGVLAVGLLAGATGAVVYGLRDPADLMYEGKPLSEVLLAFGYGQGNYDTDHQRAKAAMAKFGTNAVPTLFRMLRAKDSGPRFELEKAIRKLGLIHKPFVSAVLKNHAAVTAFQLLPSSRAVFVPELVKIYEQKTSVSSQQAALVVLAKIGPPAAALGTPAIMNGTSHSEPSIRMTAIWAVTNVSISSAIAVPALTNALTDTSLNVQVLACFALGSYGESAKPAIPALIAALSNTTLIGLHEPAARALKAIDADVYDRLVAEGQITNSPANP